MILINDPDFAIQFYVAGAQMKIIGSGAIPNDSAYFTTLFDDVCRSQIRYITIYSGVQTPKAGHAIFTAFPNLRFVSISCDKSCL